MLSAKKKAELPPLADAFARGLGLANYQGIIYAPQDYETGQYQPTDPARTVWVPLRNEDLILLANQQQQILFSNDGEMRNYVTMVKQIAETYTAIEDSVLIITAKGLKVLRSDGKLHKPDGSFVPYFIDTPLNTTGKDKTEVFSTIVEWLGGSTEDATSLLHHLATTLATSWSAVRYVLLIGDGRNGKSLLMKMLVDLLGQHNVSHVTRQQMASKTTECHDLTNRLLNVVFDGEASYLKDSGMEKTLTAGEPAYVRKLYESNATRVQTFGLFMEGLNREPKSSDKSSALQKRIVRYYFPNVYDLDHRFEMRMRSPEMLGALLALLIEHYVRHDEVVEKLAPTSTANRMKLEYLRVNSMAVQFLEHVETTDPVGADSMLNLSMPDVVKMFKHWRLTVVDDIKPWNPQDVETVLRPMLVTDRKSIRVNSKVTKLRVVTGFTADAIEFLTYLRGDEEIHDDDTAMVEDGPVREQDGASARESV
jgi:hypothetical protein